MDVIRDIAIEHNLLQPDEPIAVDNCGIVLDQAYDILLHRIYGDSAEKESFRTADMIYTTIYNKLTVTRQRSTIPSEN